MIGVAAAGSFQPGDTVQIHGLQGTPEHNGKFSRVLCYIPQSERYEVQVASRGGRGGLEPRLRIRPVNLMLVQQADHRGSRIKASSWCAQLHQVVIKNILIKKRNRKAALMEVLYPVRTRSCPVHMRPNHSPIPTDRRIYSFLPVAVNGISTGVFRHDSGLHERGNPWRIL